MTAPRTIGPYVVDREIGRGGMGVVWLAHDPRLSRSVAIKMLPPELAGDPDRLARLAREAKMLAALSHPNVAGIHGLEEAEGTTCLVLEFVDGETLADRIARGALAVEDALSVCAQIAAGLEAAHEAGVIHRDLKPSNVKITPAGVVKVLDFGLAKGGAPADGSSHGLSQSPTMSALATQAGIILGTAAYMSPEQARGRAVDRRTDVWSFGCVLFECLTGAHAFEGETVSDTLAAILRGDPEWEKLPAETPPTVRRLLRRALEKDPKKRLRDIGDARVEIEEALAGGPGSEAWGMVGPGGTAGGAEWGAGPAGGPQGGGATGSVGGAGGRVGSAGAGGRRARSSLPMAPLSIICGTLLLVVIVVMNSGSDAERQRTAAPPGAAGALASADEPTCVSIVLPDSLQADIGSGPAFDITPDGRQIAYVESGSFTWRVAVRSLDAFDVRPVTGTEGTGLVACSPDGRWLVVNMNGGLRKISISGGAPIPLCDALRDAPGLCWGPDDRIIFARTWAGGLMSVAAAGGEPTPVTQLDPARGDVSHRWPQVLPDGRHLVFTIKTATMTSFDEAPIAVADLTTGKIKIVLEGGSYGRIAAGHLIYARGGTLYAAPFDVDRLEVSGPAHPIVEGVSMSPIDGGAIYAVARDGTIAYAAGPTKLRLRTPVWVSRGGEETVIPTEPASLISPRLSPDGTKIALRISAPNDKVWVYDIPRGTLDRLTSGPGNENNPIWSPDGRHVFYQSDFTGRGDILSIPAESGARCDTIVAGPNTETPASVSPDGGTLAFERIDPGGPDIWTVSLGPDRLERPFSATEFEEFDPSFSPDGRWIAYSSTESGRPEIYVQPFPGPGGKTRVSTGGGWAPRWPARGQEIFYRTDDSMMVVPIATSPSLRIGTPRTLAGVGSIPDRYEEMFDVSPDGSRLLMMKIPPEEHSVGRINMITGWWRPRARR